MEIKKSSTKQSQSGGDSSNQLQAGTMNIITMGIDEKRVREIVDEKQAQIIKTCVQESARVANDNIAAFRDDFLNRAQRSPDSLGLFSIPSYANLLGEAARAAAYSERSSDIEVLSELLLRRLENKNNQTIKVGVTQAITVLDSITDDALLAVTVLFSIETFHPISTSMFDGLKILDDMFSHMPLEDLPSGYDWLDCLDVLRACRVNSLQTLKPLKDYYFEIFNRIYPLGIKTGTEKESKAREILRKAGLEHSLCRLNEFDNDYVRLDFPHNTNLEDLFINRKTSDGKPIQRIRISDEQANALHAIITELYESGDENSNERKIAFSEKFDEYPHLSTIEHWWQDIPNSARITSVGKAIAYANARRMVPGLPEMNLK